MIITAKTLAGFEEILSNEVSELGGTDAEIGTRAVTFKGDLYTVYRVNYFSRVATRVLVFLKKFKVATAEDLYREIYKIDWAEFLDKDGTFSVDSISNANESFNNSMFVSLKVKDAIVDQFRSKHGIRPSIDTTFPDLRINIYIFKEECSVSLDSSGSSLHLRGYRAAAAKAPINEVLASGLILTTGWDQKIPFIDPMCGSGTFLTEAAMISRNYPAGYFRKLFGFEKWRTFKRDQFQSMVEDASKKIKMENGPEIFGFDNASRSLEVTRMNLKSAGFGSFINAKKSDFRDLEPPVSNGLVILNPPYGERMDKDDIYSLYEDIGNSLKRKFSGFTAWIITSSIEGIKSIGLRPSVKKTFYNGSLECKFLKFELYEGKKVVNRNF